ncbi:hypothetical protein DPMN_167351 [Dreissena polymorpha]|uniref:THAP-type domain-containing protein n=1 Tax=Dreissena polymorpha TaxID=45954 RepID=A0A9D4F0Q4_DREPO|nr:hypothetical protein DPMN_167351 [Dreissena polymorpha]
MVICAVIGCISRSGKDQVNFVRFPSDKKLKKIWCTKIGRVSHVSKHKLYSSNKNSRVCSLRFEEDQFVHSPAFLENIGCSSQFRRILKQDAVPTIFCSATSAVSNRAEKKKTLVGKSARKTAKNTRGFYFISM